MIWSREILPPRTFTSRRAQADEADIFRIRNAPYQLFDRTPSSGRITFSQKIIERALKVVAGCKQKLSNRLASRNGCVPNDQADKASNAIASLTPPLRQPNVVHLTDRSLSKIWTVTDTPMWWPRFTLNRLRGSRMPTALEGFRPATILLRAATDGQESRRPISTATEIWTS